MDVFEPAEAGDGEMSRRPDQVASGAHYTFPSIIGPVHRTPFG